MSTFISLAGSKTRKLSPYIMESQMVSKHREHMMFTANAATSVLFHVIGFLYSMRPKMAPVRNAVNVKPGKKAALGIKVIPTKSPTIPAAPVHQGPYMIAIIATGRKPNPIRRVGVSMDRKRVRIISSAINSAITTNWVVNDFLFKIKNSFQSLATLH